MQNVLRSSMFIHGRTIAILRNIPLDIVKWQPWNSLLSLRKAADEVDHLENFYGKCHPMKTDEASLASR